MAFHVDAGLTCLEPPRCRARLRSAGQGCANEAVLSRTFAREPAELVELGSGLLVADVFSSRGSNVSYGVKTARRQPSSLSLNIW